MTQSAGITPAIYDQIEAVTWKGAIEDVDTDTIVEIYNDMNTLESLDKALNKANAVFFNCVSVTP